MIRIEDHCVGCPREIGCYGDSCSMRNVPVEYCDVCGSQAAYRYNGDDLCEPCLRDLLKEEFEGLSTYEMLAVLNADYESYEDL